MHHAIHRCIGIIYSPKTNRNSVMSFPLPPYLYHNKILVKNSQRLIEDALYIFREGGQQQFQLILQKQTFYDRFLMSSREFVYKDNTKPDQVSIRTCRLP